MNTHAALTGAQVSAPHPIRPRLEQEFQARFGATEADLNALARIKRFTDTWLADAKLRARLDAAGFDLDLSEFDLPMSPTELRPYLSPSATDQPSDASHITQLFAHYLQFRAQKRAQMRDLCAPENAAFADWRTGQITRCQTELTAAYNTAILHLPVAFELTQGCSVGCWFCGLSAAGLEQTFHASDRNVALWREVLQAIHAFAGPAAGQGILFWATDPLDNPDYEFFAQEFHAILGRYPATTTALAPRQIDRMRALLQSSFAHGADFNRFSILSLRQLHTLHAAFSPRELLFVDIIPQNRGAAQAKALTGRARSDPRATARSAITDAPATIACVSGVLINMVTRRARLIAPCASSEKWPDGYKVLATDRFASGPDLARVLQGFSHQHFEGKD